MGTKVCLRFDLIFLFPDLQDGTKPVVAGGYNAVAFSYGNIDEAIEQKNNDAESGFRPPFQVPESLLQNLVSNLPLYIPFTFYFLSIILLCFLFLDN